MTTVAVLMPAHNSAAFIAESIESVLLQSFSDWQLLIVDDGSEDETPAVAESYSARDPRIRFHKQPRAGQGAARNNGIALCDAEWIALLDSDDLWLPEKLELQLRALGEASADVAFSGGWQFPDGRPDVVLREFDIVTGLATGQQMLTALLARNRIPTLSFIGRTSLIRGVGGFDESWEVRGCEDYDLFLKLAQAGAHFVGLPERLVRYRVRPGSTSSDRERMLRAETAVLERHNQPGPIADWRARLRLSDDYRELITILLGQGKRAEARECFERLARRDRPRLSLMVQRWILRLYPRGYDRLTRVLHQMAGG